MAFVIDLQRHVTGPAAHPSAGDASSPKQPTPPSDDLRREAGDPRPEIVSVRGLCRSFGDRTVLHGVDLSIRSGEIVALLGASGSGKSTLLKILAGLDPEAGGELVVPDRRAVVFQEPRLMPWKRVTANVGLGLARDGSAPARVDAVLEEVGLTSRARDWPKTLSGGEAQRVSLARALVRDPELLLLDEPFGALDALTRLRMHALVLELWERHRPAVLLVTHDVDEALTLADRVLVLGSGRVLAAIEVDAPRPRRRTPALERIRRSVLQQLGVGLTD